MSEVLLNFSLHPRQKQAFESDATEILFGGASEGGKSHFLRVALCKWCVEIPMLQCLLIRKKYDDIIRNHVEGPTGFRALLRPLIDLKLVKITRDGISFWHGANIAFTHCQDERQFDTAQGVEKHVLAVDEATQISERLLRTFRAWVRMPQAMKDTLPERYKNKFPRIVYTANPIGTSVAFFRRNFVKAREAFSVESVHGFLRQYIPSRANDNPSVNMEEHKGRLEGIGDAAIARALDEGDWDAPVGEFFPEWDDEIHSVPDFTPPAHWFRFRSFDWGTAEPFAVYWWAVSDGERFLDQEGRPRWFPKGALIGYKEWFGCNPDKPSEGLRMRNEDMALGILRRSEDRSEGDLPTLTDSLPFQDRGGKTIAETFADCGVILTHADTSRIPGWSQLRSRLIGIEIDANDGYRTPMLYFCSSCKAARDYIPALSRHPRKPEDAAESGEATHAADAIRLACMARPLVIELKEDKFKPKQITNEMTFNDVMKINKQQKALSSGSIY